jgi:CheY-like chemotaxis protein
MQLPGGEAVKIVAVTASVFKAQEQEMLVAGMNGFVHKPYRFHEIYDAMAEQLAVKYVYADTEVEEQSPAALMPNDFSALPVSLREELLRALENLDAESISRLIEQIGASDQNLSQTLTRYTENFDYPPIIATLRELLRLNITY